MTERNTVANFKGFDTTWLGVMWSQVLPTTGRDCLPDREASYIQL
jgi:hypothetical protein